MRGNWYGIAGEWVHKHLGRLSSNEVVSGIPGSPTQHFGVPYSLTEEFVAVYRMHPLMPDAFRFRSLRNNAPLYPDPLTLPDITDQNARKVVTEQPMADLLYSFGTSNPGAITLHNYPRFLRYRQEPSRHRPGQLQPPFDLATTEIIRDRERGVPRYNTFRQLVHRPPVKTFEELTDNPTWAQQIREVYNDDINQVDLMVGLYAEPRPSGFGFSDTAFRIFILMASRRLNSDPFLTEYFTPEVYTSWGMQWIDKNGMASVLARHFPALQPFLEHVANPFEPWPEASVL
jgi:hypothetical protein